MTDSSPAANDSSGEKSAIRVILSIRNGVAVEKRARRLKMRTPPSDSLPNQKNVIGSWLELLNNNEVLYRRIIGVSLDSVEVPKEGEMDALFRISRPEQDTEMVLLVPDLPEADSLVVHFRGTGNQRADWVFDLDDLLNS